MKRLLLMLGLLAGCSGLVPSTALLLQSVDPLTADPGDIAVALNLPPGLGVLPGSVRLSLSAVRDDHGTVGGAWTLEASRDPLGREVFAVATRDHAELRSVQAQARAWNAVDPDGTKGSLSLTLGGCRTVPAESLRGARASVFVHLSPAASARPLFRNALISEILSKRDVSALPICPGTKNNPEGTEAIVER